MAADAAVITATTATKSTPCLFGLQRQYIPDFLRKSGIYFSIRNCRTASVVIKALQDLKPPDPVPHLKPPNPFLHLNII
jgi:hypothetical protein